MVKMKKMIALGLAAVLTITTIPNLSETVAYAADTAWSVLSEEDIVLDDIYDFEDEVLIGRKDGMIATLDDKLNLIQQSEYDQIDTYAKEGYLVSKKTDKQKEYAVLNTETGKITSFFSGNYDSIELLYGGEYYYKVKQEKNYGLINWETGKIVVPICYAGIDRLKDDSDTGAVFATKENGTNGFVCNGNEIGFDTRVSAKDGLVYATSIMLDSEVYYVKEFFENEDVFDDIGHIESDSELKDLEKDLEEHFAQGRCKLVFYDQEGMVCEEAFILDKVKNLLNQEDPVLASVTERASLDVEQYNSNVFADQTTKLDSIIVQKHGNVYVACAEVMFVDSDENYGKEILGIYDESGILLQVGSSLMNYYTDPELWEDYILLKNEKKQIVYCDVAGTIKIIYTDKENLFNEKHTYGSVSGNGCVLLRGENNVLIANPNTDFVKIGNKIFGGKDYYLRTIKSDLFSRVLLVNNSTERKLFFYDDNYKEIKQVNLSDMSENLSAEESSTAMLLKDNNWFMFIDEKGSVVKISLSQNPDFYYADNAYKVAGERYVYIKAKDKCAVYRMSDQSKLMENNDDSIEIEKIYNVDNINVLIYSINKGEDTYYGLMDLNGNIIADAETLKYTYSSAHSSSNENYINGIRDDIVFEDAEGNKYYYYGEDMSVHSKRKGASDNEEIYDSGITYGDVTYYKNYLDDGGREEKICDSEKNVLATYIMTKEELSKYGYRRHLYIFQECRKIVLVKQHWDGNREESKTDVKPTPTVTSGNTPEITPKATPNATSDIAPTVTPSAASDIAPTATPDVTSVTPIPQETEQVPVNSQEDKKVSKTIPARAQLNKIINVKSGKVVAKWKKASNADGYQIQYALNKKFKKAKSKTVKSTSVTIKKLKKKKTYFVRVRAYKAVDGKKVYGKWSSVKKVKIKK